MSTPGKRATAPPPELPGLLYIAPLGSGGYSDVYLYEQQNPRMKVAVKVLAAQSLLSEQARRQFSAEANAMPSWPTTHTSSRCSGPTSRRTAGPTWS